MKRFLLLFSVIVFLASCERSLDDNTRSMRGQHFSVVVESYADSGADQAATKVSITELTQLKVGIYNASGELVSDVITTQSSDLSNISVEGLPDGIYTALFIGIAEQRSAQKPQIELPARLDNNWMPTITDGLPHDNEYLYARSSFNITDNRGVNSKIALKRIVGRVEIEPNFTDGQWTKGSITSILVTFDDGSFYTNHLTDNSYSGSGNVKNVQAIEHFNFYTLPTISGVPRHGFMTIIGQQGDGAEYSVFYEFDVVVEANKRTIIRPTYNLETDQFGTIRVYDRDRTAATSRLFFQDGDSYKSVAARSFRPNALLALNFSNGNKKMTASFYSAKPVKNVTVYARRISDSEFFEIAWFESMLAFEDRTVDLSKFPDNRIYRTESGGTVVIDKMTNNLVFRYKSEDPHMKKLATIEWPCLMRFKQPDADTLKNNSGQLPYRPLYAREVVAMWTNTGYMFSSPIWKQMMLDAEKGSPFLEKGKTISLENVFFPKLFSTQSNHYMVNYIMRPSSQHGLWGGTFGLSFIGTGDAVGVQNFILTNHYVDAGGPDAKLDTGRHEYCHSLGYDHDGDFTYNKSEVQCKAFLKTYVQQIPYPTMQLLKTYANPNQYRYLGDGTVL